MKTLEETIARAKQDIIAGYSYEYYESVSKKIRDVVNQTVSKREVSYTESCAFERKELVFLDDYSYHLSNNQRLIDALINAGFNARMTNTDHIEVDKGEFKYAPTSQEIQDELNKSLLELRADMEKQTAYYLQSISLTETAIKKFKS